MAGGMLILNAKTGARATHAAGNLSFDYVSAKLLFRLLVLILDTLRSFLWNTFVLKMGTSPVLTALAFKGCIEVDWHKRTTNECFVRYIFTNMEVPGLENESVQIGKRVCGNGDSFTKLTFEAVTVMF